MTAFGLSLGSSSSLPVPAGYFAGSVILGDHIETVFMSAELWSPEDYIVHWKEAAAALLGGQKPVLFCTDYGTVSCSCFVGWPQEDGFVFEEWIIKHENLATEGRRLSYVGADDEPTAHASRFHVLADDVEASVRDCS